jgi:hypothetical protein
MSAVGEVLRALSSTFASFEVTWCLFGAHAVAVRGAPRATQDVDITARVPREVRAAVLQALRSTGFSDRYPDLADELLAAGAVVPLVHSNGMEVDLVLAGSGLEDLILARATVESVDGASVPVATATDLAVLKTLAGRGKDLEDLRALLAGGGVDVAEARDLIGQLQAALDQSDLLPAFDAAVQEWKRVAGPRRGRRTR